MSQELTVRIAGEAGQGMQTIGTALSKIFKDAGYSIFASLDYMSRIRGGNNFFQLSVCSKPLEAPRQKVDLLVCLDEPSIALHENDLAKEGILILDKEKFGLSPLKENYRDISFYRISKELGGSDIYINSAAAGIVSRLAGIGFETAENTLKIIFHDKPAEIISKNILVAKKAYQSAGDNLRSRLLGASKAGQFAGQMLLNGNEAVALGAIFAGCNFYTAYPMTPSTSIMNTLAKFSDRFNILVEQAEDEIAAINMGIGAWFAGARAMAATSGGGFALMQEGVSLAGMTETPMVVVDAQRPAPATGFPTRTEQADLDFVIYSGHGEFAKAVFSPGSIEECFYLTIRAFELADKYQIPVFILTDQHLADCVRNIPHFEIDRLSCPEYVIPKDRSAKIRDYQRYRYAEGGVSPRAVPSWINGCFYVDSDEHTEEGHITESAETRVKMTQKRLYSKMAMLSKETEAPNTLNIESAERVLIGFGSTLGVLREVVSGAKGLGMLHYKQVWPFDGEKTARLLKGKKELITVENNATAQLAGLLRRQAGIAVNRSILKYDGRPFSVDELKKRIA